MNSTSLLISCLSLYYELLLDSDCESDDIDATRSPMFDFTFDGRVYLFLWHSLVSLVFCALHLIFKFIMKVVPMPTSLSTLTLPPNYSMIFLHIESPSPVPHLFLSELSSSLPKSTNNFLIPCSDMPTPLSIKLILRLI